MVHRADFGRPSPASEAPPRLRARGLSDSASWRADSGATGWCTLRAATVAGVRHRLAGLPAEDAYAWSVTGTRLAVAVADGLGGVPGSADTARRAAQAAVAAATPTAAATAVGDSLGPTEAAAAGIGAAGAAAEGGGATTLVLAVIDPDGTVGLARVGDSTAVRVGSGEAWEELLSAPDPERPGASTLALPQSSADVETATLTLSDGDVLVLMSDGLADPWRDGPTTVAPSLAGILASRPAVLELLSAIDFSRHGCHDDRTVAAVWLA